MDNARPQDSRRIKVTIADPYHSESLLLFEHLWEDLGRLYGDTGPCRFAPADVEGDRAAFVIAYLDGEAVGCGAVRPLEQGIAEVKRMFVEPAARRCGVGWQILRELESLACALGYRAIRLETGVRQPEAARLYEKAGYRRISCYGVHAATR